MKSRGKKLEKKAKSFREAGQFEKAGNHYSLAAHEYAGAATPSYPGPSIRYRALTHMLFAATCYRLSDDQFRTRNRCEMGTLIAEDYLKYVEDQEPREGSFAALRRGCWKEYIGDLRTIAMQDTASEAYDEAINIYSSEGDASFVITEQEHTNLTGFFRSVKRGAGYEIDPDDPEEMPPDITFTGWVEYKRDQLPSLLEQLEKNEEWK